MDNKQALPLVGATTYTNAIAYAPKTQAKINRV